MRLIMPMMNKIFPARVGMNPNSHLCISLCIHFPRASGDEPLAIAGSCLIAKFSPREWG